MLNEKSIEQGMILSSNLSARGIMVTPLPGSPLAAVFATIQTATDADFESMGGEALMKASMTHHLNPHDHGEEVATLASDISRILERKTLRMIQEDINPLCREIRGEISRARIEIAEENALGLNIQMHRLPQIYSSSILETAVKNPALREQRNRSIGNNLANRLLSDLTLAQLIETIKTPSNELNVELAALVTKQDEDSNSVNYQSHIETGFEASTVLFVQPRRSGLMSAYTEHSDLLTFLFLRGVKAGKHPLVSPDSLSSNEKIELASALSAYQWAVSQRMDYLTRNASAGKVFLGTSDKKTMHVDQERYMRWIEAEENTKEVVLGALVTYGPGAAAALDGDIPQRKDLEARYAYAMRKADTVSRTLSEGRIEQLTENAIVRYLSEEAEKSDVAKESLSDDVRAVREYFNVNRKDALVSDTMYVTRAVCKTIGRGLDAEVIINEMQGYLERDGNEDVGLQKALEFAIARLLARYMAKQCRTEACRPASMNQSVSTM